MMVLAGHQLHSSRTYRCVAQIVFLSSIHLCFPLQLVYNPVAIFLKGKTSSSL